MENEVAKYEPKEVAQMPTYDRILEMAINQGAPLEQLEKFLNLKREYEAHEARKEFYQAVADFKGESIEVRKDKDNKQFNSKYVSLGNLLNTVNPVLGKYGLSVSFDIEQGEKLVTVRCILRHRLGHTESVQMTAPPDTSGGNSKNPIQQIKSTITYLRAATFEAVTGLTSSEATLDDDGNGAYTIEYIDQEQQNAINALLLSIYGKDSKPFLDFIKVGSVAEIPKKDFQKHFAGLTDVIEKRKAKKNADNPK